MRRSRLFLNWARLLTALWLFANMPQDGGRLKPWLQWASLTLDVRLLRARSVTLVRGGLASPQIFWSALQ